MSEAAWFELVFIRRNMLKQVEGELTHLVRILLKSFFSEESHNVAKAGILLNFADGSSMRIFVEFGIMLADEAALHMVYQCKGASGLLLATIKGFGLDRGQRAWQHYP